MAAQAAVCISFFLIPSWKGWGRLVIVTALPKWLLNWYSQFTLNLLLPLLGRAHPQSQGFWCTEKMSPSPTYVVWIMELEPKFYSPLCSLSSPLVDWAARSMRNNKTICRVINDMKVTTWGYSHQNEHRHCSCAPVKKRFPGGIWSSLRDMGYACLCVLLVSTSPSESFSCTSAVERKLEASWAHSVIFVL